MSILSVEELESRFCTAFGAVLLPENTRTNDVINRLAGHAPAPTKDDEVKAEAVRVAHLIAQIDANIEEIKAREAALKAKRDKAEDLKKMLRGDITGMMVRAGVKRAQDTEITVSLRKSPDILKVTSELEELEFLYPEFIRTKREIDKTAINKYYKSTGEIPEGVELVEGDHTVAISVA